MKCVTLLLPTEDIFSEVIVWADIDNKIPFSDTKQNVYLKEKGTVAVKDTTFLWVKARKICTFC